MVRDARSHRGRLFDRLVNPAKVVVCEVQRERGIEVFPLLTECVGQSGEALAPLAKRSVLAFNV